MPSHDRAKVAQHMALADGSRDRFAIPGPPPLPGAQWDELRGVWLRWFEGRWTVVEEHVEHATLGDPVDDVVLPATLAHDLVVAHEIDLRHAGTVLDLTAAEPTVRVPGAQWNEDLARWERWDWNANDWVEAEV